MFSTPQPEAVTVPQAIQMSQSGVADEEIIQQMKASGTVYRLQASQFAELKNNGVPDAVLNYMQQTYLDAVKRDAAYREWSYWHQSGEYWYGGAPYDWPYDRVYMIK